MDSKKALSHYGRRACRRRVAATAGAALSDADAAALPVGVAATAGAALSDADAPALPGGGAADTVDPALCEGAAGVLVAAPLHDALTDCVAVGEAVGDAVRVSVKDAVGVAVGDALKDAVGDAAGDTGPAELDAVLALGGLGSTNARRRRGRCCRGPFHT